MAEFETQFQTLQTAIAAIQTSLNTLTGVAAPTLDNLVDTTNLSASTRYYPSSSGQDMGNYKHLSLTGSLVDADNIMTMTVEGTNDETISGANWVAIYGYDAYLNSNKNSWVGAAGVTNISLAVDFENYLYKYYRIKLVTEGAATNTAIIKGRRS